MANYRPFEEIPSVELNTQSGDRNEMDSYATSEIAPLNTSKIKTEHSICVKSTMPKSMNKSIKRKHKDVSDKSMRTVTDETEPANLSVNVLRSSH